MTGRTNVVGLDLSLASTGVAWGTGSRFTVTTKPAQDIGYRLQLVLDAVEPAQECDLAVIELLPTHMKGTGQTGMVHGVVRHFLWTTTSRCSMFRRRR